MRRSLTLAATIAFAASLSAGAAYAAQCKDAKGKFMKCPTPAASTTNRCRDKTTKAFAKCGAPNTEPVPMAAAKPAAKPTAMASAKPAMAAAKPAAKAPAKK